MLRAALDETHDRQREAGGSDAEVGVAVEGFDLPQGVGTLALTGAVRREATLDAVLGVAAGELTNDQRLGITGGVLEQAVEVVLFMGVLDALADAQELFAGAACGTQRELDQ